MTTQAAPPEVLWQHGQGETAMFTTLTACREEGRVVTLKYVVKPHPGLGVTRPLQDVVVASVERGWVTCGDGRRVSVWDLVAITAGGAA